MIPNATTLPGLLVPDATYNLNGGIKPTARRTADLDGPDFFPTPAWATKALLAVEIFVGPVWEPACGDGAMAKVLAAHGYEVAASDLYDRGYGGAGTNFLTADRRVANIVTNPPYNSAEQFIDAALRQATGKVAMLLRLAFLEGVSRHRTLFKVNPPSRVWAFSERVTFAPAGSSITTGGTTAYAWFVWDKGGDRSTVLGWLPLGYKRGLLTDEETLI